MIQNIRVYGLEESIIAAGYPKRAVIGRMEDATRRDYKRADLLSRVRNGSGHDCFLKGIVVQADFGMSHGWWMQAQRYHWFDIVSSQSKEHNCNHLYGTDNIDLTTMGDAITARVTTNYLQLKTMYAQRKGHRREEWQEFCRWIHSLPYCEWIINKDKNEKEAIHS